MASTRQSEEGERVMVKEAPVTDTSTPSPSGAKHQDEVQREVTPAPASPPTPGVVTHRVLRQFAADGLVRLPGELVDASAWRTARSLEAMRYIAPVTSTTSLPSSDGRMWADVEVAMAYEDTLHRDPLAV